jgi:hypothetical protein
MGAAVKEKQPQTAYQSGFCGIRLPVESHRRCPGGYRDLTCSCSCHATCQACGQKLPAAQR